jgi:hypothetical protein
MTEIQDTPFVLDVSCPEALGIKVVNAFQWPTDTTECIALSARKWQFIATCCRALKQKVTNGISLGTCALCHKFGPVCCSASETCPVSEVVKRTGCKGTLYNTYQEAAVWEDAARVADDFAAFIGQLKPVPNTPLFKGFCVGNSHDGYVGLRLVSHDGMGVILETDSPCYNRLLLFSSRGMHRYENVASDAPFKDLLDENRALKIYEAK